MEQATVEVEGNHTDYLLKKQQCHTIMNICIQHEVDCCKEELPYILPSEVVPVQQQQLEASEPQSSNDGDTVRGEAEQMSSTDQTTDNVTNTTNATTIIEGTSTTVASLDSAPQITSVQEDVVEPMELDHQISIPTIIPTGMGSLYILIVLVLHIFAHVYFNCISVVHFCTHIASFICNQHVVYIELQCLPQRAALIKSILNFFKKAIPDPTFTENIRNCK